MELHEIITEVQNALTEAIVAEQNQNQTEAGYQLEKLRELLIEELGLPAGYAVSATAKIGDEGRPETAAAKQAAEDEAESEVPTKEDEKKWEEDYKNQKNQEKPTAAESAPGSGIHAPQQESENKDGSGVSSKPEKSENKDGSGVS